jgi:hypothetical protein
MGNYDEAKKFNGARALSFFRCYQSPDSVIPPFVSPALLLEKEPTNLQAQSLSSLIDKGVARGTCFDDSSFTSLIIVAEGYIGMALAGGAAALGVIAVTALIRRATRK